MARELYNAALQERRDAWRRIHKSIGYLNQQKQLTEIRSDHTEWKSVTVSLGRGALRSLDRAFQAFFRRCKSGEKPGFPRFKGRSRYHTIDLQDHFQLKSAHGPWFQLTFKGLPGGLRIWMHRPIPQDAKQKTARITKDSKGWKLQIALELPDPLPYQPSKSLGVDVGLKHFLMDSEGSFIPNPRLLQKKLKALRREQRSLSRKTKRSGNRARQRQVVARLHERVRNARADFHWKVASLLVAKRKRIVVEDLNIRGLAKGRLARFIHDVGWGEFLNRLACKAESAGLPLQKVAPAYTSQDCSSCGHRVKKSLADRVHRCSSCGLELDRDLNAAINIMRAGNRPFGVNQGNGAGCREAGVAYALPA